MTRNEYWAKVATEKVTDKIFYLKERWGDERQYEDINDYLECIKQDLPDAYKIHKRPFGVTIRCEDGDLRINVRPTLHNMLTIERKYVR